MSEDKANVRDLSLKLSRILEVLGLDESSVRRRRKTFLNLETMRTIIFRTTGFDGAVYHFGSQSEGTTTKALGSDIDTLMVNPSQHVIQDPAEWRRGFTNLLIIQDDTEPGYCRLQLLDRYSPKPVESPPNNQYEYDSRNRVVLTNKNVHIIPHIQIIRHGPSNTPESVPDQDIVHAMECESRLRQAEKWAGKSRPLSWPSQDLIQQVVSAKFFVVPVGHKLSLFPHLEWRISTSLAERYLMFSLNIVQIKCYVSLKLIFKNVVTPLVGKCITSYHCKMAVLHCMENTTDNFWREDNLFENVTRCVMIMLDWIYDVHCPHYIMPECNLFAGTVTLQNKSMLHAVVTDWLEKMRNPTLCTPLYDMGFKPTELVQKDFLLVDHMILSIIERALRNSMKPTGSIERTIDWLKKQYCDSEDLEQEATEQFVEFLVCLKRIVRPSVESFRHDLEIPEDASNLFDTTIKISYALKGAAVLLCNKEFVKAEILLAKIDSHMRRNTTQSICTCFRSTIRYSSMFCEKTVSVGDDKARGNLFTQCVMMTERETMPRPLQYELFRASGNNIGGYSVAVADCLPILYFLQCMTYRELGNRDLWKRSLDNFSQCTKDESLIHHHRETAYNLLGQCYELDQQPNAALQCYKKSLGMRPTYNVASWLVPILLYRQLKYSKENTYRLNEMTVIYSRGVDLIQ